MSGENTRSGGPIRSDEKDLRRLEEIMSRTGIDKMDDAELGALFIHTLNENPSWLRNGSGRRVYKQALQWVKGTFYEELLPLAPFSLEGFLEYDDDVDLTEEQYARAEKRSRELIEQAKILKENGGCRMNDPKRMGGLQ